jgi:hypothetical protein
MAIVRYAFSEVLTPPFPFCISYLMVHAASRYSMNTSGDTARKKFLKAATTRLLSKLTTTARSPMAQEVTNCLFAMIVSRVRMG